MSQDQTIIINKTMIRPIKNPNTCSVVTVDVVTVVTANNIIYLLFCIPHSFNNPKELLEILM